MGAGSSKTAVEKVVPTYSTNQGTAGATPGSAPAAADTTPPVSGLKRSPGASPNLTKLVYPGLTGGRRKKSRKTRRHRRNRRHTRRRR
jgi:hypothetical protein